MAAQAFDIEAHRRRQVHIHDVVTSRLVFLPAMLDLPDIPCLSDDTLADQEPRCKISIFTWCSHCDPDGLTHPSTLSFGHDSDLQGLLHRNQIRLTLGIAFLIANNPPPAGGTGGYRLTVV